MSTDDLALFLRVVRTGSLSAAARELNISPALASAAIKRLEARVGETLLVRSTRQLRLSDAGEQFLPFAEQATLALQNGLAQLDENRKALSGTLKVATSSDLGRNTLLPWFDNFLAAHPALSLNLLVSDQLSDFYRDRVDLAIRYGSPNDSNEVAFRICDVRGRLYASPDYLARFGTPDSVASLANHACLVFHLQGRPHVNWSFHGDGGVEDVTVKAHLESNDSEIVRRWACAGKGVMVKSELDVREDVAKGRLVPILPQYTTTPYGIWLVVPGRALVTPAVIALRDSLRDYLNSLLKTTAPSQKGST